MILKDFNINLLAKLLTQQLEQVNCIECCKFYSVPVTAECGHTLCKGCWYGRKNCPVCALTVDKKIYKLNLPLQSLTSHVQTLIQCFENLMNIKLAELENVSDWLEDSQNKFSAPVSSLSTQDLNPDVEYLTSEAQIHTSNVKPTHQTKKDSVQSIQEDWDKIEILEDGEDCIKHKENVTEPIGAEIMDLEEIEYTSVNPRRSTRKKEISINKEFDDIQNEKTESIKSIKSVVKQTTKMKQTWNQAKKMRQEFSRLNKENRNKLNVSIETVKISQVPCSKTKFEKENLTTNIVRNTTANESSKESNQEKSVIATNFANPDSIISNNQDTEKSIDKTNECDSILQSLSNNKNNTSIDSGNPCDNEEVMSPKVKFLKKGALHVKSQTPHTINQHQTKRSDDVLITIRVGKVTTNVCISQDNSDPQVKIHIDKDIQTSSGPKYTNNTENIHNNIIITEDKSTQFNSINSNFQNKTLLLKNAESQSHKDINSDSAKKNTASADTRTAQFEITASCEKELPDIQNVEDENRQKTIHSQKDKNNQGSQKENIPEDMEGINDLFDSEFSKSLSKSLKASKNVPSTILVPTQNKSKTYTPVDKRLRSSDSDELPLEKKQKLNTENVTLRYRTKLTCEDSECPNYDVVMEKVFANIDADIGIKNNGKPTEFINKANSTKNTQVLQSQNYDHNSFDNQKDSENLFTNFDNEAITQSNKLNTQRKATNVSHNNSLTSNLRREFISPDEENIENENIELGTPMNDDSDVSIVEETPQKNVSNIKVKQKSGISSNFNDVSEQSDADVIKKANIKNIDYTSKSLLEKLKKNQENTDIKKVKNDIITPSTINKFVEQIQHKSTPVARKSLNFSKKIIKQDAEETLCNSLTEEETTQEKEFMNEVFQEASSPEFKSTSVLRERNRKVAFCVAGSCLLYKQTNELRQLCRDKGWRFVEEYTDDVTHLVIGVDEENKCKRSLKYMRAVAAGKWIVGFGWVEKCIQTGNIVSEEGYECMDMTGAPGPRRSRLGQRGLFTGIAFYCMPNISLLDHHMLNEILVSAGGRVVSEMSEVRAAAGAPGFVLAEPDHTQDSKYEYLAMDMGIVPVHCEWALNCLGQYALAPLELLCSPALLTHTLEHWPQRLTALIQ